MRNRTVVFGVVLVVAAVLVVVLAHGRSVGVDVDPKEVSLAEPAKIAVEKFMSTSGVEYEISRVELLPDGTKDYLVELEWVQLKDEKIYLWVAADGRRTQIAEGVGTRPVFERFEDQKAWFKCTFVADSFPVFPYYRIIRPWQNEAIEAPWFGSPKDASYRMSKNGLCYELEDVEKVEDGVRLAFRITGPAEGEVMAGGARPPLTIITESPGRVSLVLSNILSSPEVDALRGIEIDHATIENVLLADQNLEIVLGVPGKYSVVLCGSDSDADIQTLALLFAPK